MTWSNFRIINIVSRKEGHINDKQKLTKLICFGLVAIMSVTAFASCTDSGSGKEKETDSSVTTSAKDEEQSDADALVESLYGDRNYNGQKVRILALPCRQYMVYLH